MEAFVTALTTALTPAAFWGAIEDAAPLIVVLVLIAFGYRILRRLVSGASKGKAKFQHTEKLPCEGASPILLTTKKDTMLETVLIPAFWATASQLVQLIVPIVTIWFVFKIMSSLLFSRD